MAKAKHGEYGAFTVGNGLRFQFRNKLIKEGEVPPVVVETLKRELGIPVAQIESRFNQATSPEETAKVVDTPAQRDEEGQALQEAPLNPADFELVQNATQEAFETVEEVQQTVNEIQQTVNDTALVIDEFLKSLTIQELAKILEERFGVYTIWLNRYPENDEISPITGEPMPHYEVGMAYNAAKRAFIQGRLTTINYEGLKKVREESIAQGKIIRESYNEPVQQPTEAQNEAQNNFDFRTSVRAANQSEPQVAPLIHVKDPTTGLMVAMRDPNWEPRPADLNGAQSVSHPGEVEKLVQPPLNQAQPTIRPNW